MGYLIYALAALILAGGFFYWRRKGARIFAPSLAYVAAIALGSLVCAAILARIYVSYAPTLSPEQRNLYALLGTAIGFAAGATLGAMIAAPLWLAGVIAIRNGAAPRPWGDIVVGLAASFAILAVLWRPLALSNLAAGHPPWHWAGAAVSGAVAGLVYWRLAGRPKPPYDLSRGTNEMSEADKAAVREYVDAFNAGDFDRLRAVHTPDAIVRGVLGWGAVDDAMPIWRDLVNCLAIHLEIEEMVAEGSRIAVRFKETGTAKAEFRGNPATGKSYELVAMEFYEIKDGKIHRRWGARDAASQARQLGWTS